MPSQDLKKLTSARLTSTAMAYLNSNASLRVYGNCCLSKHTIRNREYAIMYIVAVHGENYFSPRRISRREVRLYAENTCDYCNIVGDRNIKLLITRDGCNMLQYYMR